MNTNQIGDARGACLHEVPSLLTNRDDKWEGIKAKQLAQALTLAAERQAGLSPRKGKEWPDFPENLLSGTPSLCNDKCEPNI